MSRTLLERLADKDEGAVAECLDRYANLVWSLALRSTRNATEAEDAVQDIFIHVWKSAPRFDATLSSEATWIAMIARRRLIDRRRRASRTLETEPLSEQIPVIDSSLDAEQRSELTWVSEVISRMPADQRRALELAVIDGYTHAEIASATGTPLGTVKTWIRRGLMRIRDLREGAPSHKVPR